MKARQPLLGLLAAAALCACTAPKYVSYASIRKDFSVSAPWGWSVMTDEEGTRYAATTFIGPFEPEFYLGAPSLSVRWYAYYSAHRLPDGLLESYASADDFISQTIANVYGPEPILRQPVQEIEANGHRAKHFVVLSPVVVPPGTRWGTSTEVSTGRLVNLREHAYVVLPLSKGFYVLIYPATRGGFGLYEPQFNQLVNTFTPLSEGPGGPKIAAQAAPEPAPSPAPSAGIFVKRSSQ